LWLSDGAIDAAEECSLDPDEAAGLITSELTS